MNAGTKLLEYIVMDGGTETVGANVGLMAYFGRVILLIGNKAFILLLSCVVTAAETSNSSSNEKKEFVMININKICMIP